MYNRFFMTCLVLSSLFYSRFSLGEICGFQLDIANIYVTHASENEEIKRQLRVTRTKESGCAEYFIAVSSNSGSTYRRRMLSDYSSSHFFSYNLYLDSNRSGLLADFPEIGRNGKAIVGDFRPGERSSKHDYYAYFQFESEGLAYSKSGRYSDTVQVKLYSGSIAGDHTLEDSKAVSISTQVQKRVSVSLANSSQGHHSEESNKLLDFGELKENESLELEVHVKANTAYSLSISSHNQRRLKHQISDEYIPYSLSINGREQAGHNGIRLVFGENRFQGTYSTHNMTVKIGNVTDKLAGRYSDFVTITTSAN